jgi:hypothetical protein
MGRIRAGRALKTGGSWEHRTFSWFLLAPFLVGFYERRKEMRFNIDAGYRMALFSSIFRPLGGQRRDSLLTGPSESITPPIHHFHSEYIFHSELNPIQTHVIKIFNTKPSFRNEFHCELYSRTAWRSPLIRIPSIEGVRQLSSEKCRRQRQHPQRRHSPNSV